MEGAGAPVEGWPNSMWMIEAPSPFGWWAILLMAMAWNGSILTVTPRYLHRSGMTQTPFSTPTEPTPEGIAGPWRTPRNMLVHQEYDDHASIHDDATAQKMGFKGGAVEGPTHFSQLTPL